MIDRRRQFAHLAIALFAVAVVLAGIANFRDPVDPVVYMWGSYMLGPNDPPPRSLLPNPDYAEYVQSQRTLWITSIAFAFLSLAAAVAFGRSCLAHRRVSRGLCARCGYPCGTSAVCTECGHNPNPLLAA